MWRRPASASSIWSSRSTSISTGRPAAAATARRVASPTRARQAHVVVLDQDRVVEARAVRHPAPRDHGALLERAQERRRLPGVADPRARARHRLHEAAGEGGHARQPLQEVQGHALGLQQARAPGPSTRPRTSPAGRRSRLRPRRLGEPRRGRPRPRRPGPHTSRPETTSSSLARRTPRARASSGTVARVVRSRSTPSSSRARRTSSRTSTSGPGRLGAAGRRLGQLRLRHLEGHLLEGGAWPRRRGPGRGPPPARRRGRARRGTRVRGGGRGPEVLDVAAHGRPRGRSWPGSPRRGRPPRPRRRRRRRRPAAGAANSASAGQGARWTLAADPRPAEPRPRPDLLGHVGEEGREEPQEDVLSASRRVARAEPRPAGIVLGPAARLHHLHVGVGEAAPEEALDGVEGGRVLEGLHGLGGPGHRLPQAGAGSSGPARG